MDCPSSLCKVVQNIPEDDHVRIQMHHVEVISQHLVHECDLLEIQFEKQSAPMGEIISANTTRAVAAC